jgi:pilus assembly protein CpaF
VDAAAVEERVRDAVRSSGIDPLRDPESVRALVDAVVRDAMATAPVDESVGSAVFQAVAGFGPLQAFLDDPSVEELWINEPGRVFIAREGRHELTTVVLREDEVRDLVERMLRLSGRRLDLSSPFVDAMLPDGSRLHVVIPDITRQHWAVNIRRFVVRARSVHDLVALGVLTSPAARFLEAAVVAGLSIVVAGSTQAGKTTFLNALLGSVPASERIISCEEVFEVQVAHPDWIALQTRDASIEGSGEIPLRRLIRESLRMRPTRLVVGEVRQAEALDLLIAMNSGLPAMATLHANSAREAITKLCTLPLLAGRNIDSSFIVPTVAACVDLVVHLRVDTEGRRVTEILALSGSVESGVVATADLFHHEGGRLVRGRGFPPHLDRFARSGIDIASVLRPHEDRSP